MSTTGTSSTPQRIGGGLCVNLIADLPNLDVSGLTLGTPCYVAEVAADFVLKVSNAAVNHSTVEAVSGVAGLRWLSTLELTINNLTVNGQLIVTDGSTFQSDLAVDGTLTTIDVEATSANFTGNVLTNRSMKQGTDLTNADVTKAITDGTEFALPATTLTANHTITLATTGSPITGQIIRITRLDVTAHTYAVINGGVGAGTKLTFANSVKAAADFKYDGTNWNLDRFWNLN